MGPWWLIYMPPFPKAKPSSDSKLGLNSFWECYHSQQSHCILSLILFSLLTGKRFLHETWANRSTTDVGVKAGSQKCTSIQNITIWRKNSPDCWDMQPIIVTVAGVGRDVLPRLLWHRACSDHGNHSHNWECYVGKAWQHPSEAMRRTLLSWNLDKGKSLLSGSMPNPGPYYVRKKWMWKT